MWSISSQTLSKKSKFFLLSFLTHSFTEALLASWNFHSHAPYYSLGFILFFNIRICLWLQSIPKTVIISVFWKYNLNVNWLLKTFPYLPIAWLIIQHLPDLVRHCNMDITSFWYWNLHISSGSVLWSHSCTSGWSFIYLQYITFHAYSIPHFLSTWLTLSFIHTSSTLTIWGKHLLCSYKGSLLFFCIHTFH